MMTELRLTTGELAFGVGVVSTLGRALEIVRAQLGVADPEGRAVLAASGQSLIARELATRVERDVRLIPPLHSAAELIAGAEWLLRCVRVTGARVEAQLFHLAPTGILAQAVDGEVVHRISAVPSVGALIDRAASWFNIVPALADAPPPARLDRMLLDEIGRLPRAASTSAIERALIAGGVPLSLAAPFADDLEAPAWKGAVTLEHCPKGGAADVHGSALLIAGARTWLIETSAGGALLSTATRERFAVAVKALLRGVDSTTRKLDRAGELA